MIRRTPPIAPFLRLLGIAGLVLGMPALNAGTNTASAADQPGELGPPAPPPFKPAEPRITSKDPTIAEAVKMLSGSFRAPAAGDRPALDFHAAVVNVSGLDNALYFEIARADAPQAPFRAGILHLLNATVDGTRALRLRIFDFTRLAPTFGDAVVGLWAAPEMFPPIDLANLAVNAELVLTREGSSFTGVSGMTPTTVAGATHFSSRMRLSDNTLVWDDRGFAADGTQVWGATAAGQAPAFTRFDPDVRVQRMDGYLTVIDLVPGDQSAPPAQNGSQIAVQYTGWVLADGFRFDSSRDPGREAFVLNLPLTLIEGWNRGVPGIREGGVRRLIIPSAMGYGERGNPRARIPGGATLVFEIECVFHRPPESAADPAGAPAANP